MISIDATPKNILYWFFWGFAEKLANHLNPFLTNSAFFSALASSRRSIQLYLKATKLKTKPNIICAHNMGTLYPAHQLSKKWDVPFVFDVEDYHPGEFIHMDVKNEKRRREYLMKNLLSRAMAITSASPLIGKYTLKLIGGHPNHTIILNSFPQNEFKSPLLTSKNQNIQKSNIKLIWFSQNISFGRGIEELFEALSQFYKTINSQSINVTLIGYLDKIFEKQIIHPFLNKVKDNSKINISILPPLAQEQLHNELSKHDIGLALELNTADLNRKLCLTNKIITYAQAGLYILATDTPAQKAFIKEHTILGKTCSQNLTEIIGILKEIKSNSFTDNAKMKRFEYSKKLCWEEESKKLMHIWKKLL
nr:hypothetical protein [uncultured Carboxylicivirga sp.]